MRRKERSKNYCHSGSNVDPPDNRRRSQKSSEDGDGGASARRKLSLALQQSHQEKPRDSGNSCIYSKRLPHTRKYNNDANSCGKPRNNEHNANHRKVSSIMLDKQRQSLRENQDKTPIKWTRKNYSTAMVAAPHDRSPVLQRHTVGACRRSVSSDAAKKDCYCPSFDRRRRQSSNQPSGRHASSKRSVTDDDIPSLPLSTRPKFSSQRARSCSRSLPTHHDGVLSSGSAPSFLAYRRLGSMSTPSTEKREFVKTPTSSTFSPFGGSTLPSRPPVRAWNLDCGRPLAGRVSSPCMPFDIRASSPRSVKGVDIQSQLFSCLSPLSSGPEDRSSRDPFARQSLSTRRGSVHCSGAHPSVSADLRDIPFNKRERIAIPRTKQIYCNDVEGGICDKSMDNKDHACLLARESLRNLKLMETASRQVIRRCEERLSDHSENFCDIGGALVGQYREVPIPQELCIVHARDGSIAVFHRARPSTPSNNFQEFKQHDFNGHIVSCSKFQEVKEISVCGDSLWPRSRTSELERNDELFRGPNNATS